MSSSSKKKRLSSHDLKTSEGEAEQLFRTFLSEFTLSEADRTRRETALLELPNHLKEAERGRIKNVVLFPFGTFYHGLGFKDDLLTAFVSIGSPQVEKKKAPTSAATTSGDEDSDSSGYAVSSSSSEEDSSENEGGSTSTAARNEGRMRQTLLLDINEALINRENGLSGTYKKVSLTRQAKLYFRHHQTSTPSTADLGCLLEAKSFIPVQTSRLIKFYCLLEQLFWPLSQLLLNWARKSGVLEHVGQTDNDGLKQDHLLLLIIFFLVRRRILPSFKLLQEWSKSQMIVNEINVAFCENVAIARKNCQMMKIGSRGPEEWTLERIMHLALEFFSEMSEFNFTDEGISPSLGTSFSKFSMGQLLVRNPTNKRRLDTNSLLCIQDVLDHCQNVTRKVQESWVLKFRSRCKGAAEKLHHFLWNGDELLNATLSVLDGDDSPVEELDIPPPSSYHTTPRNRREDIPSSYQSRDYFSPQPPPYYEYDDDRDNFTHKVHSRVVNVSYPSPYTTSLPPMQQPIMPISNRGTTRGRGRRRGGAAGGSSAQSRLLNKMRKNRKMPPY